MILLWKVFERLLSIIRTDACAEERETAPASKLLRLPPEIILLVAEMLLIPSAACLALCNRRLSHILGPGFWNSLRSDALDVRLAFLSSVAKDLPQHFLCQECVRLHRLTSIKWPRIITPNLGLRCTWRTPSYRHCVLTQYEIYFPHIYLAMKQHYYGADIGFPLQAFQYFEVVQDLDKQRTTLLSVDAQIVSDELLQRSQTCLLLPWSRRNEFTNELAESRYVHEICVHSNIGPLDKKLVSDLVGSSLHQLEARQKCHTQTFQCPYCYTDYMLDAIDFGERGFALIATRWINLGAGLEYADAKWQSQISGSYKNVRHPNPHPPGDTRADFEGQAELSVKELTAGNELKLFSKRQNRLVCRGSDGLVWKWNQYNRWYLAPSGPERSFWEFLTDS